MTDPLHDRLPEDAVAHPLPGTRPLRPGDWLRRDERFAEHMALRDRLLIRARGEVIAQRTGAQAAVAELLEAVLCELGQSGPVHDRPDGVQVPVNRADPLATLGRICQEDFAVMLPGAGEHWLAAGVICFPSRWRLAQKIGRPLTGIHRPVAAYDAGMALRVQRLFDGVRVEQPLVRWNHLPYPEARLFNPRSEAAPGAEGEPEGTRPYLRMERQVIKRLPETGAVVFSIHTWLIAAPPVYPLAEAAADS